MQVPQVKLGYMKHVEPSFVLYALHLGLGGCVRAHIVLHKTVEPVRAKKRKVRWLAKEGAPVTIDGFLALWAEILSG